MPLIETESIYVRDGKNDKFNFGVDHGRFDSSRENHAISRSAGIRNLFYARRRVEDLLVQEENKLGANLELLNNINKHLADGRRRIKQQNARVIDMEQSGNDSKLLTEAKALLDGTRDTQQLHLRYRLYVLRALKENALID